jgi:hypothetical protein
LPVWPQVPRWQTRHRSNRAPGTKVAEWRGRGLRSERLPPLVLRDYHTGQHPSWRSADLGRGSRPVGRVAARTSRRLVLVVSPPAVGILSLPVKMQSVVRALTADTVIFEATTLSTMTPLVRVGRQAAGQTHDRPRRALALVIAKRESGNVTTVLDLRAKQTSTVTPIPPGQKPAPRSPSPPRGPDAV